MSWPSSSLETPFAPGWIQRQLDDAHRDKAIDDAKVATAEYVAARGVEMLAGRVRELEAENARLRAFAESITDVTGPYPYLDKTQIVADARAVLADLAS